MAEGVQLTTFNGTYFCYSCNYDVKVSNSEELVCPRCSSTFLIEVSEEKLIGASNDKYEDSESEIDESEQNLLDILTINDILGRTDFRISLDELDPPLSDFSEQSNEDISDMHGYLPATDVEREDFLRAVFESRPLADLTGEENPRAVFERRLQEYIFQNDMDALSTWLLNEAEVNGPLPLPKEEIKLLPIITVSQEQIDNEVQCTICMENFHLEERAKSLPCDHFFHESCITPWLERHATCPNCRKSVERQPKNCRSQSCPRTRESSRSTNQRRSSESSPIHNFFSSSTRPFLF